MEWGGSSLEWQVTTSPSIAPAMRHGTKDEGNIAPRAAVPMRKAALPIMQKKHSTHDGSSPINTAPATQRGTLTMSQAGHGICTLSQLDAALPMRFAKTMEQDTIGHVQSAAPPRKHAPKLLKCESIAAPVTQNNF